MGINEIIIYAMVVFAVLGAIDRMIGNRFGLGEKFEEGIESIGVLAVSMIGMISLAPVLAELLQPVIVPLCQAIGSDPAMLIGAILANDMGGAALYSINLQNTVDKPKSAPQKSKLPYTLLFRSTVGNDGKHTR